MPLRVAVALRLFVEDLHGHLRNLGPKLSDAREEPRPVVPLPVGALAEVGGEVPVHRFCSGELRVEQVADGVLQAAHRTWSTILPATCPAAARSWARRASASA